MPYSQAPTNDTYSSHRIPLVTDTSYRVGSTSTLPTKYTGMVNILPFVVTEEGEKRLYGMTRSGIQASTVNNTVGNVCRGLYVWEKTVGTIYYFVVVNTKVYTSTNGTTWTNVTTLLTNVTTPVRFTEFIDSSTNTKSLIMVDGIEGYVFTSNAAGTKITDVDFPSPHVPFPIFLDGYLFLAKANTGDIYNSDLNTPSTWTAGNFISSEMYPDDIQALVRINNYILAIGTTGSEYFYDAGNSPGSPLARVEGAALPFGTVFPNAIASTLDSAVVLAKTSDGESVFKYVEGLKFKDLPGTFIPLVINQVLRDGTPLAADFRGFFFKQFGKLFYTFNTNGADSGISNDSTPTFTFSFETEIWSEFKYDYQEPYPVMFTAPATSKTNATLVAGHNNGLVFYGYLHSLNEGGTPGVVDRLTSVSMESSIYEEIKLPPVNFGTMNLKTMSRLAIAYSTGLTSETPDYAITTNDNDGTVGSTYVISMSTSGGNYAGVGGYPFITQLGVFRQRTITLNTNGGGCHTWRYLEVDINKHQQ